MTASRRLGAEGSRQRTVLMDAAEAVLADGGYAGLSARSIADRAGLTKQLLYYYYRTLDDLILDVVRRVNERRLERFEAAMASDAPLAALWALASDPANAGLATELTAIATHREAVRAEIVTAAQRFRALQIETVAALLADRAEAAPAAAGIVMIAAALGRTITGGAALGLTEGHAEALAIVERMLARLSARAD